MEIKKLFDHIIGKVKARVDPVWPPAMQGHLSSSDKIPAVE